MCLKLSIVLETIDRNVPVHTVGQVQSKMLWARIISPIFRTKISQINKALQAQLLVPKVISKRLRFPKRGSWQQSRNNDELITVVPRWEQTYLVLEYSSTCYDIIMRR